MILRFIGFDLTAPLVSRYLTISNVPKSSVISKGVLPCYNINSNSNNSDDDDDYYSDDNSNNNNINIITTITIMIMMIITTSHLLTLAPIDTSLITSSKSLLYIA